MTLYENSPSRTPLHTEPFLILGSISLENPTVQYSHSLVLVFGEYALSSDLLNSTVIFPSLFTCTSTLNETFVSWHFACSCHHAENHANEYQAVSETTAWISHTTVIYSEVRGWVLRVCIRAILSQVVQMLFSVMPTASTSIRKQPCCTVRRDQCLG